MTAPLLIFRAHRARLYIHPTGVTIQRALQLLSRFQTFTLIFL